MACIFSSSFIGECTFERGYTLSRRLTFNNAFCLMPYLVRSFPENYSHDPLFSKHRQKKKKNQANYSGTLKEMEWNWMCFLSNPQYITGPSNYETSSESSHSSYVQIRWATDKAGWKFCQIRCFHPWGKSPHLYSAPPPSSSCASLGLVTSLKETFKGTAVCCGWWLFFYFSFAESAGLMLNQFLPPLPFESKKIWLAEQRL